MSLRILKQNLIKSNSHIKKEPALTKFFSTQSSLEKHDLRHFLIFGIKKSFYHPTLDAQTTIFYLQIEMS